MLDRDTILMNKSRSESNNYHSDFHECLYRVKDLFEKDDGLREDFLESVDGYLQTLESDK